MSQKASGEKIVVLTVRSQKSAGEKVFRLHKKRAVLGSSTSADVRLADPSVSPVHAIFEVSGVDGKPVIYDLASDTGLEVNGKPAVQATLQAKDQVRIGPYLIQIRVQEIGEVPEPPEFVKESFGQKLFVSEKEDLAPLLLEDERDVIDIFDHRPEAKTSLQVVMFYGETILDVEHFTGRKRIVIGPGTSEDFSIPPFLGAKKGKASRFELVTADRGGSTLLHLHESMDGVVNQGGKLIPVKQLLSEMTTGPKALPLGDKDFAKVRLDDVSFFLNFTPAPPRLKRPRIFEKDPLFLRVWGASLAFTLALLSVLANVKVNPVIEIEQLPERVATIIYEPRLLPVEKPPPPPKPKVVVVPKKEETKPAPPVPKKITITPKPVTHPAPEKPMIGREEPKPKKHPVVAKPNLPPKPAAKTPKPVAAVAAGHEGEGARAKGLEGSRGAPNKPKSAVPQTAAKRPGAGPKSTEVAMNRGHSETDDLGVVDVFKSEKGTLNKLFAGGKGAAAAASKLEGYGGFTSKGEGGLGAAGTAKGGGGTSEGLGGLSDKGAGGGKKGAGLGALGSGGNILGSAGKLSIEGGGVPEPIVLGAIDTDAIAREIAKHRDEIKYCYEKEINAERPDLAGRVGINFVIGASGIVTRAGVSSTSLRNRNTESCVVAVIRRIQFPPIRGGGIAEVTYPFVFKPSNK